MCSYVRQPKSSAGSDYVPSVATIGDVRQVSPLEKVFTITHGIEGGRVGFRPGQFFMVGLPGYGEAPISISAGDGSTFELCVRRVGNVTEAMHRLTEGDTFTIRGPYGNGFDTKELEGRALLFVAGGIGLVPMRSLIKEVLKDTKAYGRLTLLYGARKPEEMLFCEELTEWRKAGIDVRLTIDKPHPQWNGHTGVITTLIPETEIDPANTDAVVIGPPVMYKFVITELEKKGLGPEDILVSLERRMKCGLGKCGHCQINDYYSCQEGPVFRMSELAGRPESM